MRFDRDEASGLYLPPPSVDEGGSVHIRFTKSEPTFEYRGRIREDGMFEETLVTYKHGRPARTRRGLSVVKGGVLAEMNAAKRSRRKS